MGLRVMGLRVMGLRVMGLTTLETRRIRPDMIDVYIILNGLEGIESGSMFIKRVGISRGRSQKLLKNRVRLDGGKYCFGNRVCDERNRLPGEEVNAGNVDSFKGRLDQYYRCIRGFE